MGVKLPKILSEQTVWKTIELGGQQAFEVCVKPPTFQDQVLSLAARTVIDQYRLRITRSIVDWRGVHDDQSPAQPVAFSADALMHLISAYPQALHQIDKAILHVWYVLPEDLEKNLPAPPEPGGATIVTVTPATTLSSPCGPSSGPANNSAANSET